MERERTLGAKQKLSNLCPNHPKVWKILVDYFCTYIFLIKASYKVPKLKGKSPFLISFANCVHGGFCILWETLLTHIHIELNWGGRCFRCKSWQSFQFGILTGAAATWPRGVTRMSIFTRWRSIGTHLGQQCAPAYTFQPTNCVFDFRRGNNKIVLCETYKYNKKPTETNHRKSCNEAMDR